MDWKKVINKLLFPPGWVIVILVVITAVAIPCVFILGLSQSAVAYAVYPVAFYTVCVVTAFCAVTLPKGWGQIKGRLYAHPLASRYLTDRAFRTKVSLYVSLCVNLLYVLLQGVQWYLLRSWWFVVLAVYYVILSVMRFLLVGYVRRNALGSSVTQEWKRARTCACILLLVNLSLSGAVLMILYQDRGFEYSGILIYIMAVYTFYSTIHAIVDIIRYRKLGSPVMSTAKIVSLSAALVSMLNLETAMFSQFGADMAAEDQRLMIMLTGAGVSIVVVTLSAQLILRATNEIRRNKDGK